MKRHVDSSETEEDDEGEGNRKRQSKKAKPLRERYRGSVGGKKYNT